MLTDKQLELHNKYITGSKVASILGLCPWKSKWQLFCEMHGDIEPDKKDTMRMRAGGYSEKTMDEIMLNEYNLYVLPEAEEGKFHPHYPYLWGLVDRLEIDRDGNQIKVWEYKNVDSMFLKQWEEGIPNQYQCQLYFYMTLYNLPGSFLVLFGGNKWQTFELEPNPQIQNFITAECVKFWDDLQNNRYPDPDGSDSCTETLKKMFPSATEGMAEGIPEVFKLAKQRQLLHGKITILESEKAEIDNKMRLAIGESQGLDFGMGNYVLNKKTQPKTMKFDDKRFLEEEPELYQKYLYLPEGYRTLRYNIKEVS